MAALRQAWGAPFGLSGTKWMLEIAAVLHRTDGFYFQYPEWPAVARELCSGFAAADQWWLSCPYLFNASSSGSFRTRSRLSAIFSAP